MELRFHILKSADEIGAYDEYEVTDENINVIGQLVLNKKIIGLFMMDIEGVNDAKEIVVALQDTE